MKKTGLLCIGLIAGAILTLAAILMIPSQRILAVASTADRQNTHLVEAGSNPTPSPSSRLEGDEQPPANIATGFSAISALPTAIPGETLEYFVPTDSDATATILFLYNTDAVDRVVALRGFSYNGVLVYSLNITVKADSFLRLSSDSIVSAPPPSWATPAPIITNFTDFTYLASLSLPHGVKVEGYTLYNPGTGVVDPRTNQGEVPLRFSTDPATVFLPVTDNVH